MSCKNCGDRDICVELCPAAQAYADQDYVGRREMVLDPSLFDKMPEDRISEVKTDSIKSSKTVVLSHREWEVLTLLVVTKDEEFYDRCMYVLEISYDNARTVLKQVRKRLIKAHH